MTSEEFKVVSWSPLDPITDEKLDAMVQNDNWLRDNMTRAQYSANSVQRDIGVRIASGLALITSGKKADASRDVVFGSYFSESCKPIVTTGVVSSHHRQVFATVDGPGSAPQPTRDGFTVHVVVTATSGPKKIKRNFYVAWHAIGY
jgi:hypothetical protein